MSGPARIIQLREAIKDGIREVGAARPPLGACDRQHELLVSRPLIVIEHERRDVPRITVF